MCKSCSNAYQDKNIKTQHLQTKPKLVSPLHNPPRKLRKSKTRLNLLPQIRLRKNSQRIPCNPPLTTGAFRPLHKMRHGAELAPRDELERFACLEGEAVFGDVDFHDCARAGADV